MLTDNFNINMIDEILVTGETGHQQPGSAATWFTSNPPVTWFTSTLFTSTLFTSTLFTSTLFTSTLVISKLFTMVICKLVTMVTSKLVISKVNVNSLGGEGV